MLCIFCLRDEDGAHHLVQWLKKNLLSYPCNSINLYPSPFQNYDFMAIWLKYSLSLIQTQSHRPFIICLSYLTSHMIFYIAFNYLQLCPLVWCESVQLCSSALEPTCPTFDQYKNFHNLILYYQATGPILHVLTFTHLWIESQRNPQLRDTKTYGYIYIYIWLNTWALFIEPHQMC